MAMVVREDFQGMGIGSCLLEALETIAKENGYKGFIANILAENLGMISVCKKRYANARITKSSGGEVVVLMDFDDPGLAADGGVSRPAQPAI